MEQESRAVTTRRRQTQERLLDAAFEVLARDGIDGASVEAVCEAAGFTRGAFYSNFETKTELFLALIEREHRSRLEHLRTAITALGDSAESPRGQLSVEQVTGLVEHVLAQQPSARDWYLISLQFELLALRQPDVAPRYLEHEQQLVEEVATVLEGVATALGQRFVMDARAATALIMSGYRDSAKQALLRAPDDHDAELRRLLADWLPATVSRITEPL